MVSTVTSRPNHYEVLGLAPSASAEEIKAAFAREIGRPRAFGGIVELSVAYESLRDPARRRAYDDLLGFNQPKAPPPPRRDSYSLSLPTLHLEPPRRPEPVVEPRLASFIASSVRSPASADPRQDPPRHEPPRHEVSRQEMPRHDPAPIAERRPMDAITVPRIEPPSQSDAEQPAVDLKRPVVVVGGLVAAVALIGAWAGVTAGNAVESQPPARAVTVALPRAKAVPVVATPAQEIIATAPMRHSRAAKRVRIASPPSALAALASENSCRRAGRG